MTDTDGVLEILPGVGVGPLVLGMTRDEVEALLGGPEEVDEHEHEDGTIVLSWVFAGGALEADFGSDEDYVLGAITVADPGALLHGRRMIGLEETVFLAAARSEGIHPLVLDAEYEEVGARDYAWDQKNMAFWVMGGRLQRVTVMPLYDASGNVPQWPSRSVNQRKRGGQSGHGAAQ